jgi:hypothetical protein
VRCKLLSFSTKGWQMTQPNQNRAKPHLKNTMAGPRAAAALLLCATALPSTLGAVSRIPITVNRGRSNTTTGLGSTGHGTVTHTHTHTHTHTSACRRGMMGEACQPVLHRAHPQQLHTEGGWEGACTLHVLIGDLACAVMRFLSGLLCGTPLCVACLVAHVALLCVTQCK